MCRLRPYRMRITNDACEILQRKNIMSIYGSVKIILYICVCRVVATM